MKVLLFVLFVFTSLSYGDQVISSPKKIAEYLTERHEDFKYPACISEHIRYSSQGLGLVALVTKIVEIDVNDRKTQRTPMVTITYSDLKGEIVENAKVDCSMQIILD